LGLCPGRYEVLVCTVQKRRTSLEQVEETD